MTKSIMITGVGGQGTLLASRILGRLAISAGYDVKVSEVHGMSQRGGSVVTYVRYGKKVSSPIIDLGGADVLLAFESLEAYRYLPYLKAGGRLIVNTQHMMPMPVVTGAAKYPAGIEEEMAGKARTTLVDALALAKEAGETRSVNVALLGVLAQSLEFSHEAWRDALKATVKPAFLAANEKAFELGYGLKEE
ncbi:indolepyruvate oxidoreductase subunit beta [Gehongia tenuis]